MSIGVLVTCDIPSAQFSFVSARTRRITTVGRSHDEVLELRKRWAASGRARIESRSLRDTKKLSETIFGGGGIDHARVVVGVQESRELLRKV